MWLCRTMTCLALMFVLQGCSRHGGDSGAATGAASGGAQYDSEKVLNVYSWADYIAPETVGNFERETGIKVHYGVYDNNEALETQLLTGHTNYDVVNPQETSSSASSRPACIASSTRARCQISSIRIPRSCAGWRSMIRKIFTRCLTCGPRPASGTTSIRSGTGWARPDRQLGVAIRSRECGQIAGLRNRNHRLADGCVFLRDHLPRARYRIGSIPRMSPPPPKC